MLNNRNKLLRVINGRLRQNITFLFFEAGWIAAITFFFWTIITNIYDIQAIGNYALLLSGINGTLILSQMGINYLLINNYELNKKTAFTSAINFYSLIVKIYMIVSSVVIVIYIRLLVLTNTINNYQLIILIISNLLYGISMLLFAFFKSILIVESKSKYIFYRSILIVIGHLFLVGIIIAYEINIIMVLSLILIIYGFSIVPVLLASGYGFAEIFGKIITKPKSISDLNLKEPIINHVSYFFVISITFLYPLIVQNYFGAKVLPLVYIPFMISNFFVVFSISITSSYYAEAIKVYNNPETKSSEIKLFQLEIIKVLIIFWFFFSLAVGVFGRMVLGIFGPEFVDSYFLLMIFCLGQLLFMISQVYTDYWRIVKNYRTLTVITLFIPLIFLMTTIIQHAMTNSILIIGVAFNITFLTIIIINKYLLK